MGGKKLWIVVGIITALIGGAIIYAATNKADMPTYSQETAMSSESSGEISDPPPQSQAQTAGNYVDYTDQAFADAKGRRWLFFHAGWCPQCRAIEQDIKQEGAPDGVTILKVDYDSQTALKKKYGVTLQTTFVEVDDDGNEIKKFVAYSDPTLQAVIKALDS